MEFYVSIAKLLEKLLYSLTCPLTGKYDIMQKQLLAERIERLFFEVIFHSYFSNIMRILTEDMNYLNIKMKNCLVALIQFTTLV